MTDPDSGLLDDHEKYAGEVIPDPWEDPEQTDWPNQPPLLDPLHDEDQKGDDDA